MGGRNYYKGDCQTGQLTDRGYLQELAVGEMYRSVYVNAQKFLPTSFDPSVTYFRSDQSDRFSLLFFILIIIIDFNLFIIYLLI